MNIAQLSEQLKDVPQGTLIGYAKNPNSVVPQFLALAEIQRRQHLQAPAQAPTGTVADDVLAQAAPQPMPQMAPQQMDPRMAQAMQQQAQQLPENQPGVAQLPSGMPQGMAAGGIVAFAGGGMPSMGGEEEDYQEYLENAEQGRIDSGIDSAIAGLKGRVAGMVNAIPNSVKEAASGIRAALPPSYEKALSSQNTSEGLKDIHAAAEKYKLPVALLQRISNTESGGDPTSVSKTGSSAAGLYGFLGGTWDKYKVSPEDRSKPEVQHEYGARFIRENVDYLKKKLGRDPTFTDIYTAHYFGPTGAASLLNQDPDTPMKTALSEFESPKRVDLVMKQNPNLRGKTVGQVLGSLKSKMGEGKVEYSSGGITGLAAGGSIPKFAAGKSISLEDYDKTYNFDDQRDVEPSFAFAPQKMSQADYFAGQDTGDFEGYAPLGLKPESAASVNPFDAFISKQNAYQDELIANKKQDAYLALMQAGLGMMGGSSPYALQNIGQGGAAGINAYATLAKQRAADLAASRKLEGSAISNRILNEIRQSDLETKKQAQENLTEYRADRIKQNQEKIDNAEINATNMAEAKRRGLLDTALKNAASDDDYQATSKILKEIESVKPDDPKVQYYRDKLEAIRQSYIQTSLKGEYVPPKMPVYTPPIKPAKKGVLQSIRDVFTTSVPPSSSKAPSSSKIQFDANGNLIQ